MEYSTGGYTTNDKEDLPLLIQGGIEYILPLEFFKRYKILQQMLDELNQGVDNTEWNDVQ